MAEDTPQEHADIDDHREDLPIARDVTPIDLPYQSYEIGHRGKCLQAVDDKPHCDVLVIVDFLGIKSPGVYQYVKGGYQLWDV